MLDTALKQIATMQPAQLPEVELPRVPDLSAAEPLAAIARAFGLQASRDLPLVGMSKLTINKPFTGRPFKSPSVSGWREIPDFMAAAPTENRAKYLGLESHSNKYSVSVSLWSDVVNSGIDYSCWESDCRMSA